MITYSTNWMGPAGMWWYRENGFTKLTTKTLDNDSALTNRKRGDVVEYEEVTEYWYGGRIDVYGLDTEEYWCGTSELALPIMDAKSWSGFSTWLRSFESTRFYSLQELVTAYETTNPAIRWFAVPETLGLE